MNSGFDGVVNLALRFMKLRRELPTLVNSISMSMSTNSAAMNAALATVPYSLIRSFLFASCLGSWSSIAMNIRENRGPAIIIGMPRTLERLLCSVAW